MHRRFYGTVDIFSHTARLASQYFSRQFFHSESIVSTECYCLIIPFDDSRQNNNVHYILVYRSKPKAERKKYQKKVNSLSLPIFYPSDIALLPTSLSQTIAWIKKGFSILNIIAKWKEKPNTKIYRKKNRKMQMETRST